MAKRIYILVMLTVISMFMQGCGDKLGGTGEKIVPPNNQDIPIGGIWRVTGRLGADIIQDDAKEDNILNTIASFSEDEAVFGDDSAEDVQYKIRRVRTSEFFLYQYKMMVQDLGIDKEKVDVISITSGDKPFYEFVKLDQDTIITFIDNSFYTLTRELDEDNRQPYSEGHITEKGNSSDSEDNALLRSGVLLGFKRVSAGTDGQYDITYRTLWIRSENRECYPILGVSNLFTPRKTGFWEIGSITRDRKGYKCDALYAYPILPYDDPDMMAVLSIESSKAIENLPTRRHIRYVGNDYIAVENISMDDELNSIGRQYQVLPIDNIQNNKGIKISDIAGEMGKDALLNSAKSSLELNDMQVSDIKVDEEDFTVVRRNGHWIMRGRLAYQAHEYLDFNIDIIPPNKLVNYDELCIPWNAIKAKLPTAIDAYTSPNEDLLLALDMDNLYVYTIEGEEISDDPIYRLSIYDGEEVVMAEWATGVYVERWDKYFKAQNPVELNCE